VASADIELVAVNKLKLCLAIEVHFVMAHVRIFWVTRQGSNVRTAVNAG
jgi:hypothetical protein